MHGVASWRSFIVRARRRFRCLAGALAVAGAAVAAQPATLVEILETRPGDSRVVELADERRNSAMRDAALAYGMQSGLVRRAFEIRSLLDRHARQLDRVYRFDRLLIERDGFLIAPPAIAETTAAFQRGPQGMRAATARRVLRIERQSEVLGGPPGWRGYFERSWEKPRRPSEVLFPRTDEEIGRWRTWVREGWEDGVRLAEDSFAADLERLNRDFVGIVNWRILEAQRIVTSPDLAVMSRSVVGGGDEMRLDEREITVRAHARLNPVTSDWVAIEEAAWPR